MNLSRIFGVLMVLIMAGLNGLPATAADPAASSDSALVGIRQRGELRIGLEVGYMPCEMVAG
ncbi:MAG TPA: hypothetical protein VLT88_05855, partial [Desulfosarcina sp.]|nr:hypothetical protein [Desulfosarcina sp.]